MKRINLLSKQKQHELVNEHTLYSVSVAVVLATLILILGVVVQLGVWVYLDRTAKSVSDQITQLQAIANKSENADLKQQIKLANNEIQDFSSLYNKTPQWSDVLAAFVKDVPNTVKITQFDAQTDKQLITISGYSPTRDLVIDLYNNINADKDHFKNIDYPLANVTQPTDVRFFFTFSIADGVLTKGQK